MKHYSEAINTVIFQKSWTPIFQRLSEENAGKLIKAIYDFMNGEEPELEDDTLDSIFLSMVDQIERSAKRYFSRIQYDDE